MFFEFIEPFICVPHYLFMEKVIGMSTIWGQHYLYKYQIPQIVDPQIFVQIVVINFHTKFQKNVEKISKLGSKTDKMEYF